MRDEESPRLRMARDLEEVRTIVTCGLRGHRARIYLFGSRAAAGGGRTSDIDVGVLPLEPIPRHVFSEIREALDQSDVLLPVDLVDLSEASESLRGQVMGEGVAWND